MKFIIKKIILIIFFLFLNFINGKSFEASTLVLTLDGYVQIKDIFPGHCVISDNGNFHFENTRVVAVLEKKVKSYLKIKIDNEIIKTTSDENFSIGNNLCKKVKNLQISDFVEFNINSFSKINIKFNEKKAIFYSSMLC